MLTLGILGLVLCGTLGPFAWHMGRQALLRLSRRGWRIVTIALVILVSANWFYVLTILPAN